MPFRMSAKGVIFDLDGTLYNSMLASHEAVCEVFTKFKVPCPELNDFLQNCVPPFFPYYRSRGLVKPTKEEIQVAYVQAESERSPTFFEDVVPVLRTLKEEGCALGLVSARPLDRFPVDNGSVLSYFDRIEGGHTHKAAAILKFCRKFGLRKDCVWFVGDGTKDMKDGLEAGVISVGITRGSDLKECLVQSGARHCIEHLDELLTIVLAEKELMVS